MAKETSIGIKLIADLKEYQANMQKAQTTAGKFGSKMSDTASLMKSLVPALSFAAVAAGATYAFNKIMSGTDAMADRFEFAMAGMNNGLDFFWKTLASGDWTNFWSNFKSAIDVGYEYAAMIDAVQDKTRSLTMVESDARAEALKLEEMLKNKGLSNADRLKAGQDRIALEVKLSKTRKKIAEEELAAELLMGAQRTGLSNDQLLATAKDIDSEAKLTAAAYNAKKAQLEKMKRANVQMAGGSTYGGGSYIQLEDTAEMKQMRKELEAAPVLVKNYASALSSYGNLTQEMMDRLAAAYVKRNEAENSAAENTKKTRTMVNSLLADGNEELSKEINLRNKLAAITSEKSATSNMGSISTIKATSVSGPSVNTSELQAYGFMGDMLEANTEKAKQLNDELGADKIQERSDNIMSLSNSFGTLGNAIGGAAGSFLGMVSTILGLIPTLIAQISALTVAQVSSSNSITMAKGSEAIASGTAASQSVPFPLNLIALAATIASIVAALATNIKGKHAFGGVIPGTSFSGDNILTRVNSGEEVLTANDPRHIKNRPSTGSGGGAVTIVSEAKIKGEDLYILLKKTEQRIARRT